MQRGIILNLFKGEGIIEPVRKSWITVLPVIVSVTLLMIGLVIAYGISGRYVKYDLYYDVVINGKPDYEFNFIDVDHHLIKNAEDDLYKIENNQVEDVSTIYGGYASLKDEFSIEDLKTITNSQKKLSSYNPILEIRAILTSVYLLLVLAFTYISWLDYYLDILIITNKRLIKLEQVVLFGRKISETSLHHIQDASSDVKGFLNSLLNVGTVNIETAGENDNFSFHMIRRPSKVAADIIEYQRKAWNKEGIKDTVMNAQHENINKEDSRNKQKDQDDSQAEKQYTARTEEAKSEEKKITIKDERTKEPSIQNREVSKPHQIHDGRVEIEEGMIWQGSQEINDDILSTLGKMDKGKPVE